MTMTTTHIQTLAALREVHEVLGLCNAPPSLKARAAEAYSAARRVLDARSTDELVYIDALRATLADETEHPKPAGRQGWDVCARQQAGRLVEDLMRANREASPLESLLLLPLLAQARQIHDQLVAIAIAIAIAIDATPEN